MREENFFDPARDGFGFRNPISPVALDSAKTALTRLDALIFGRGLCFGMAVAALSNSLEGGGSLRELPDSPAVIRRLKRLHVLQFRPDVALLVALYWLCSGGGRASFALRHLRLAEGRGSDPHIVCFGPSMSRRFFRNMPNAHAVAPYRMESRKGETRVYVYDPNHPGSRSRYISFSEDGGFRYGGFTSEGGFGISLVPISALGRSVNPPAAVGPATQPR